MRILLIFFVTVALLIASLVVIVALGMHHLKATNQEADQAWRSTEHQPPATAPAAATAPSAPTHSQPIAPPAPPEEIKTPQPIVLWALDANLIGGGMWAGDGVLYNWKDPKNQLEWPIDCAAGAYTVQITYSLDKRTSPIIVEVGGQTLRASMPPTTNWWVYSTRMVGRVTLKQGKTTFRIKPAPGANMADGLMNLLDVTLAPPGTMVDEPTSVPITLTASNAELHGDRIARSGGPNPQIVNWIEKKDWPDWSVRIPLHRDYQAYLTLSDADATFGDFDLTINKEAIHCHAGSTDGFDHPKTVPLGRVSLPAGIVTIEIKPTGEFHNALMNFWKLEFVPAY